MYEVYLGDVMFPIAPSSIELKTSNKNNTAVLIDWGEINFLRQAGLADIRFELLIPSVKYPFAVYKDGFKTTIYYLNHIKNLKANKKPFLFKVVRTWANGKFLSFKFEMKVSLEEYTVKDDANDGFDVKVAVNLKQYRDYGTRVGKVEFTPAPITKPDTPSTPSTPNTIITEITEERETENSPDKNLKNLSYYTTTGITTWELAEYFYKNMFASWDIERANKRLVENGIIAHHYIPPNTAVVIPARDELDLYEYKDEEILIDTVSIKNVDHGNIYKDVPLINGGKLNW